MVEVLVTGGAGFIGSNFVHYAVDAHADWRVTTLDKLTYAGRRENLQELDGHPRHRFVHGDVADPAVAAPLVRDADVVVHFAAETHVDRSLMSAGQFIQTDVYGTFVLLEAARRAPRLRRFVQISTDEVLRQRPGRGQPRDGRAAAPQPVRRQQGRRGPPGLQLLDQLPGAGRHHARLEQLRPAAVPGEGDPAVHHERESTTGRCRCTATASTSATGCTSTTTAAPSIC